MLLLLHNLTNAFQLDLDYNDKNNERFSSCINPGEFRRF